MTASSGHSQSNFAQPLDVAVAKSWAALNFTVFQLRWLYRKTLAEGDVDMRREESPVQRLTAWMEDLEKFDLPDWDSLPQLDLYMDQVILLLNRYLSPIVREEKYVTASIINNYVRMKVMPPPVKKRYARAHLAYLIIICTLKQSLSISCIQRMLPAEHREEDVRMLYTDFVRQYRASVAFLRGMNISSGKLELSGLAQLGTGGGNSLVTTSAILSTLSKALTEYLLQEEALCSAADEDDE